MSFAAALCMAACGGSGGDGSTGTGTGTGAAGAVTTFPLRAAYKSFLVNGYVQTFIVSGDCAGTALQRSGAPVSGTFQGAAAWVIVVESGFTLPGCTKPIVGSASVQYFDADFRALGAAAGPGFAKYDPPLAIPEFVRVGDGATLGTETLYGDATLSVRTGRVLVSYSILADAATSALTRFTTQTYDASERLLATQTATYRLGFDGSFVATAVDIRNADGSLHLVLTAQ